MLEQRAKEHRLLVNAAMKYGKTWQCGAIQLKLQYFYQIKMDSGVDYGTLALMTA